MAATVLRRSCGMRGSGAEVPKKEGKMTTSIKLAVPTMGAAGLNAERSGHFGHCDCFTVVDIVDGVVSEEATMVANRRTKRAVVCARWACSPTPDAMPSSLLVWECVRSWASTRQASRCTTTPSIRSWATLFEPLRLVRRPSCLPTRRATITIKAPRFTLRGSSIELPRFFLRRNRAFAVYRVARIDIALR